MRRMWDEQRDQTFFRRVLRHSDPIEQMVQRSLEYKMELQESMNAIQVTDQNRRTFRTLFIPLGTYFRGEERFEWYSHQVNRMFLHHMKKHYRMRDIFGESTKTIQKLFQMRYQLPEEYRNVLSYFVSMMNPGFRLVRFENEEKTFYFYGLAKIDCIPYTFDFSEFILS